MYVACAAGTEWRRAQVFRGGRERRDARGRSEKEPLHGRLTKVVFLCALRECKISIG